MNRLTISVTKFESVATGEADYGFMASDDHDTIVERGWGSLEAFLSEYPTSQALFDEVVTRDAFWLYKADGMFAGNVDIDYPNA